MVLIYDDVCQFCTAAKGLLERWGCRSAVQIECLPAHAASTQASYPDLSLGDCMDAMYFIDERDRIWKGALAFREILRFLPMGWILRWIYFVPGGTGFSHRLYGMIARNRFLFGRRPKAEEIGVRCRKNP